MKINQQFQSYCFSVWFIIFLRHIIIKQSIVVVNAYGIIIINKKKKIKNKQMNVSSTQKTNN
jgi:hypothetical protein